MIQCECAADEVMPDCPIHGERPIVPPEYLEAETHTKEAKMNSSIAERIKEAERRLEDGRT